VWAQEHSARIGNQRKHVIALHTKLQSAFSVRHPLEPLGWFGNLQAGVVLAKPLGELV
jgi:hypothetical protein